MHISHATWGTSKNKDQPVGKVRDLNFARCPLLYYFRLGRLLNLERVGCVFEAGWSVHNLRGLNAQGNDGEKSKEDGSQGNHCGVVLAVLSESV